MKVCSVLSTKYTKLQWNIFMIFVRVSRKSLFSNRGNAWIFRWITRPMRFLKSMHSEFWKILKRPNFCKNFGCRPRCGKWQIRIIFHLIISWNWLKLEFNTSIRILLLVLTLSELRFSFLQSISSKSTVLLRTHVKQPKTFSQMNVFKFWVATKFTWHNLCRGYLNNRERLCRKKGSGE